MILREKWLRMAFRIVLNEVASIAVHKVLVQVDNRVDISFFFGSAFNDR